MSETDPLKAAIEQLTVVRIAMRVVGGLIMGVVGFVVAVLVAIFITGFSGNSILVLLGGPLLFAVLGWWRPKPVLKSTRFMMSLFADAST